MLLDLSYCEFCGKHKSQVALHNHHIKHRAAGGQDIKENIVKPCGECYAKCHSGEIKIWQQIEKVASRLGKTPEEICETIGLLADKVLPKDYVFEDQQNPLKGLSLEDVLQAYFSYEEIGEQAIWGKAEILAGMVDAGWKVKTISSLVGCSPATIRERVRTYKAFPDVNNRALDKTFTHHRIAAKTDNPLQWIQKVCEEDWSTRQLEEVVKAQGQDKVIQKDILHEKAERALRMINEVFIHSGEPADWLKNELEIIILKERGNNEKKGNTVFCIPPNQTNNNCENDFACEG